MVELLKSSKGDSVADKPNWTNQLYFGDNLNILRDYIDDESVDLV